MTINQKERSVLLVGSIPLSSAEEVFEAISSELGKLIKRIPDGETGPRSLWIVCQSETMKSAQGLEVGGERQLQGGIRNPRYKIKEGQKLEDVKFGRLGYADNALESYKIFKRLQAHGKIPSGVRFQVCLPTPLAVVYAFFIASEVRRIWPLYEQRLLEELDEIARTISHGDLAIQLDIATEMHTLLEVPELQKDYPIDELVDAFARLGNRVPHDVELGIHLCYGDPGHKHVREPTDMGRMIDVYHRLATAIPERSLGCICRCRVIASTIGIFRLYAISSSSQVPNFISVSSILRMGSKVRSAGLRQRNGSYRILASRPNAALADGHRRPFRT